MNQINFGENIDYKHLLFSLILFNFPNFHNRINLFVYILFYIKDFFSSLSIKKKDLVNFLSEIHIKPFQIH